MSNEYFEGEFTLQWHITHRCNLRCAHCYQKDYTAFEEREALTAVLDQYQALLGAYRWKGHLNITGGEPLTHPDLFWLLEEARRRGLSAAVLTNGTLIGKPEALRLKRCGVQYVQVSLDGCERTHDAIRGRGSFQRAVGGVSCLLRQGIDTTVSFTAQRQNYRELPRLARFCRRLGVNKLWFDRVVIPAGEDDKQLSLSPGEFQKLCRGAARLNQKQLVSCARALQFLPCRDKHIYRCTAGTRLLTVLADGSIMPCRRLPLITGNVRDSDLLTVYRGHPDLLSLRRASLPEECRGCAYEAQCAGGARCIACARTGRFDAADPDCPIRIKKTSTGGD